MVFIEIIPEVTTRGSEGGLWWGWRGEGTEAVCVCRGLWSHHKHPLMLMSEAVRLTFHIKENQVQL